MCAGPIHLGKFTYIIGPLAIIWVFFITALFVLPTVRHLSIHFHCDSPLLRSPFVRRALRDCGSHRARSSCAVYSGMSLTVMLAPAATSPDLSSSDGQTTLLASVCTLFASGLTCSKPKPEPNLTLTLILNAVVPRNQQQPQLRRCRGRLRAAFLLRLVRINRYLRILCCYRTVMPRPVDSLLV